MGGWKLEVEKKGSKKTSLFNNCPLFLYTLMGPELVIQAILTKEGLLERKFFWQALRAAFLTNYFATL